MNNQQNDLEDKLTKKSEKRAKKKRNKMKVSGKKVFELKKIIEKKGNNS
jgi:hypothetical protein